MKSSYRNIFTSILSFFIFGKSYAHLSLPSILSDNMVLQQKSGATIWGWTTVLDETITVSGSWNNLEVKVKAKKGIWYVKLPTPTAGGPYKITIRGHEAIILKEVMIGEVWLCSGQSNMEWAAAAGIDNSQEEISKANHPNIRFFIVPRKIDTIAQKDVKSKWEICTPETMKDFSAVGYFFGEEIEKKLQVPIGLIGSYWGGTSIEVWTRKDLITDDDKLANAVNNLLEPSCCPQKQIGQVYNAMIHPLINYGIAGVLWYQGEANRNNNTYYETLPLLIHSWRKDWKKQFPFYLVQLAPFKYEENEFFAPLVRDAQLQAMLNVPNTGMVVTNDIGNLENVHPTNKKEVGRRLSFWALAKTYGVQNITYSGPIYKSMKLSNNKVILHFNHTGSGLIKKGEELKEFFIAGKDKVFYRAKAEIKGKTVIVYSLKVRKPVAVRLAFSDTALPNLYNKEGLPASAFRTDKWSLEKK
ncbi:MAG: sialate O-acetylesterase [Flavobacterium sp.]